MAVQIAGGANSRQQSGDLSAKAFHQSRAARWDGTDLAVIGIQRWTFPKKEQEFRLFSISVITQTF